VSVEPVSETASDETIRRLRAAVEAGDVDGVVATTAPGVVVRSPITDAFVFRGQAELRELMEDVLATVLDIRYYEEIGDARTRALFYHARVGTQAVDEATLVRLDDQGRITEFTIWYRPLRGLTRVTAGLAPRLARRQSPLRSRLAALGAGLLALVADVGEGPLLRLVGRGPERR
jgi:hypothetical protein